MTLANVAALGICYGIYRAERRRLGRTSALTLVLLIFLLTSLVNQMHKAIVDHGVNHFRTFTNLEWQTKIQNATIQMAPDALPHSYRFLPNSIVRWIEIAGLDFEAARNLYRLYFGLLVFYALYRFTRSYTTDLAAIVAMLLTTAIYPVSFRHYAGQLTDPMSHLSFLLCFIFLQTEDFPLFLSSMLIGSLAKETVLAMAGYYVLFGRRGKYYPLKSAIACVSCAAMYLSVRLLVLKGAMGYRNVSGVGLEQVWKNWQEPDWRVLLPLTAGAMVPFLILGWQKTPLTLKRLFFFLLPVIFVSSLFFSWLVETRNFMPVVFVLAVVSGNFLCLQFGSAEQVTKQDAVAK